MRHRRNSQRALLEQVRLIPTRFKELSFLSTRLGHLVPLRLLAGSIVLLIGNVGFVYAELPTGMQTVSGTATFQSDGNTLNITASNKAIINYQSFNIGSGNTVNIYSPLSLNRVTGGNPSSILGNLNSTGKVFLINPSGIIFGQGSQVNVQGLVASTLQIKDDDFLSGHYSFQNTPGLPAGSIINHGQLLATDSIALLSGAVQNTGTIQAPTIQLAVGDQLTYFASPEIGIDVQIGQSLKQKVDGLQAAIANSGTISGQSISLQAKLAQAFYETTVNNSGIIKAQGLSVGAGGKIVATAQSDDHLALLVNTGQMLADGSSLHVDGGQIYLDSDINVNTGLLSAQGAAYGVGGQVALLGSTVQNSGNSEINASGDLGGGTILVGGDYQGLNPLIRNALSNYSSENSRFLANANGSGNGGKIILWADHKTTFLGTIEAKGGTVSGNGGFVETSGKQILQALGLVNANATNGQNGQWLLDPNNIAIANTAQFTTSSGTNPLLIESTDDDAMVLSSTIQTALNSGTNVTIQTSNGGTNAQVGDITVYSGTTINKTSGGDATLTLKSNNSINFDGGTGGNLITIASSGSGNKLNLVFNADTDQGSDGGAGGGISVSGVNITTNGGNLILGGGSDPTTHSAIGTAINTNINGVDIVDSRLSTGSGNILMNGQGNSDPTQDGRTGIHITAGSVVQTTTGNITFNGDSGNAVNRDYGIYIEGNNLNSRVQTQDGTITLNALAHGTGFNGTGLRLDATGKIVSTGTGKIVINATGGNGTSDNAGIFIDGNGIAGNMAGITSVNGDIDITAKGGITATDGTNYGIKLINGVQIASSGTGAVTVHATGGSGTNNNTGISLDGYGNAVTDVAKITTNNGNLTINATGGNATTWNNHGIQIAHGGAIESTGSGAVVVNGTGGAAGGNDNYGIDINANNNAVQHTGIFSNTGNLAVTGHGGGNGSNNNYGLYVEQGGSIASGSGNATLSGIKGVGNNSYSLYTNGGSNILGSNSQTGNLTLAADDFNLNNVQLRSAGKIIFQPYTNSLSVGLNGGAGTLSFDNTYLSLIDRTTVTPSAVAFGSATAANNTVTVGNNWDVSSYSMPLEIYGGNITMGSINTGSKSLLMRALVGDLTINNGAVLSSTASGNAVVLAAAQNFVNNAGDTAINNSSGRWLVYSSDPTTSTEGFTSTPFTRYNNRTFTGNPPSSISSGGNLIMYSYNPLGSNNPPLSTATTSTAQTMPLDKVPYIMSATQTPNTVLPTRIQAQQTLQAIQTDSTNASDQQPLIKTDSMTLTVKETKTEDHPSLAAEGVLSRLIAKHSTAKLSKGDSIPLLKK